MAKNDIKLYSRSDIAVMKAQGKVRKPRRNAPKYDPPEEFWKTARMVETRPRRTSVHLRVDPDTVDFYRLAGPGHLTRMAYVLKTYADAQVTKHMQHY